MTALQSLENPYPGLRPFQEADSDVFFGRDEQIDELLKRLHRERRHFVAVVGTSGSGKSSLVRAGLLPALDGGLSTNAGSRWRVATLTPGHKPVDNLAAAISAILDTPSPEVAAFRRAFLERSSQGLVEIIRQGQLAQQTNVLLVVDQFEEVFTRRKLAEQDPALHGLRDEFAAFVRLLIEAASQDAVPIYVVLTMRSDYLGACSEFRGLPELLNDSQYLVPRLSRDQLREAIEGPLLVKGGELAPRLLQRLINEAIDDQDQLPVLQHALMRTWARWQSEGAPDSEIDYRHYQSIGTMATAISVHADEILATMSVGGSCGREADSPGEVSAKRIASLEDSSERQYYRRIAQVLFRCLVNQDADGRRTSRPTLVSEVAGVANAAEDTVLSVAHRFSPILRIETTSTSDRTSLAGKPVLMLSHESVIRRWKALVTWIDDEVEKARAFDQVKGWKGIPSGLDLDSAIAARKKGAWSQPWAERYGGGYERVQRKLEQGLRARRLRTFWKTGLVVGLFFASSFYSWVAMKEGQSLRLAAESRHLLNRDDGSTALGLALQSWKTANTAEALDAVANAAPQLLAALIGHSGPIYQAGYSTDGQRIVTASDDTTARVWNATSGEGLLTLKGHTARVWYAEFSPDGRHIVTASDDKTARIWDAVTGHLLVELKGHSGLVRHATFSPDGKRIVTASDDTTARVWDAVGGQLLAELKGHTALVFYAEFSPDSRRIATASDDRTARVWSTTGGPSLLTLEGHADVVRRARFSGNGQRIVTTAGRIARVWNAGTGQSLAILEGHTELVRDAEFSRDGEHIVTASSDRTAGVWRVSSGEQLAKLEGHWDMVRQAKFSADGQWILTASFDHTARVWNAATGQLLANLVHRDWVRHAEFSADGQRVLTASDDNTAGVWNLSRDQLLVGLEGHANALYRAAYSADGGRIVTASRDKTARVWAVGSGQTVARLKGHSGDVFDAAFSPDGQRVVTASDDATARVWNGATGQSLFELRGHTGLVRHARFAPDGRHIVTASGDGTARVWDSGTGHLLFPLEGHAKQVRRAEFSPDGQRIVTASDDTTARWWDATSGRSLATLQGHMGRVRYAKFSPDGRSIVTASDDSTARVWDPMTGHSQVLEGHGAPVSYAEFSPDGKRIVTASDDCTARVWNSLTGGPLLILGGHAKVVRHATFSLDGQRIVTGSEDHTARVWNATTGELLIKLEGHTGVIPYAEFSPDGQSIITASFDQTARVSRVSTLDDIARVLK